MKNVKLYTIFMVLLSSILLSSCIDDSHVMPSAKLSDTDKVRDEISVLIGKTLQDKSIRKLLHEEMRHVKSTKDDEMKLSISYILGQKDGIKANEVLAFDARNNSRMSHAIKQSIYDEFSKNIDRYAELKKIFANKRYDDKDFYSSLSDYDLEIYYPYDPEYLRGEPENYYVSYQPEMGSDTGYGYYYENGRDSYTIVDEMNNEFADTNPVYGIVPIARCELEGDCIYALPTDEFLPPPISDVVELKWNVDHSYITDSDVLTATIPEINIVSGRWRRYLQSNNDLIIFFASADGVSLVNGEIQISGKIDRHTIRVKKRHEGRFVSFNRTFDSDWNMVENEHVIAVYTEHWSEGSKNLEVNVKAGAKIDNDGKLTTTVDATVSKKLTKNSIKDSIFRGFAYMTRSTSLATIVGPGYTGMTRYINGVNYNVKDIQTIMQFYVRYHYKDLAEIK